MTHRDTVPIFVHHHHAEEHAKRKEEESIDVVLDGVANRDRKGEEDDLGDSEERSAEDYVSDRPPVLKGAEDENELGYNIDNAADKRPKDINDPEANRLCEVEPGNFLECRNRNEKRYAEDDKGG